MRFTKAQKERIESALGHSFGRIEMRIDGHDVTFEVRPGGDLKYFIMPFIDGRFTGGWLFHDSTEFGSRLLQTRLRRAHPKKYCDAWRKIDKKRAAELDKARIKSRDFFRSPKQLVAHLAREFESVEIVDV